MKKYKYSMTYDGPKTWHTCGPITVDHAKNQFKAFGVVYQCNGVWLLDYDDLAKPKKEEIPHVKPKIEKEGEKRAGNIKVAL